MTPLPDPTGDGITNRELYDAIVELRIALTDTPDRLKDHETRLRALEKKVYTWSGAAAVAGVIGSTAVQWLLGR